MLPEFLKGHCAIEAVDYYFRVVGQEKFVFLMSKELEPLDRIRAYFKAAILNMEKMNFKFGCFGGDFTLEMGDVKEDIAKALGIFIVV